MTKEERAELRRLAEAAAHVAWWKAVDKIQDRAGLHESADAFIGAANPANVLSLLDTLEAKEVDLQKCKSFAYCVGFSDGFARATNYNWIGPVPNNPYDDA